MSPLVVIGFVAKCFQALGANSIAAFQNYRLKKNGSEGRVTAHVEMRHMENIFLGGLTSMEVCSMPPRMQKS